ncbi:hypothetical protein TL16_g10351 [Triparma laevis f. inornata]|uniref:Tubby C-terminal domain-containing protein n=1 Tax=Triparma laevis f. inornata TaxID=1714386 RepID=A0A9W7ENM3_9STRA|nr:hypothetical protein TL16_g10351 [Triparma laevis f. inornata]
MAAPPSGPRPFKDKTNNARGVNTRPNKGKLQSPKEPRNLKLRKRNVDESMESEDSWANESMESGGSKNYSDGDDDRNASVFSENGVNEEHDESSYPDDNDEYLLDREEEKEESKESSEPIRRSSQMRAEDKVKQKPVTAVVTKTRMAAQPETKLSKLEKLMNASKFHGVSHLLMAPKEEAPRTGSGDMVTCVIIRDKKTMAKSLYPRYNMYFQDGNDTICLVAEKQSTSRTAHYNIFDMTRGAPGRKLSKKAGNYLGKLRGSRNGTDYSLFNSSQIKEQVAGFVFEKVSITKQLKEGQIPRKLHVLVPPLDSNNTTVPYQAAADSEMCERFVTGVKGKMTVLHTKEPTFERGQYRLNFHGRVTTPSVKNFQIVNPSNVRDVIAQFGRVSDSTFHLDFKHPLNAFQAFAMALAQFNL